MDNVSYNAAISDVVALLDHDIAFTDQLRLRKTVSPAEDVRMVEQVRKMIVLKARIGSMIKGPDIILPDSPLNIKIERPE